MEIILRFALFLSLSIFYAEESKYFIAIKKNDETSLEIYTPFLPPEGRYYADPFLIKYEGVHYLFFEDYDYQKGVISYVTLDQEGIPSKPAIALELSTHLSFPHIFLNEGKIYMVPETYRYRSISLYECVQFPNGWKRKRMLVQGEHFSDPILFKHNGYYWLFTSVHKDRLRIYYAKDLHSKFFPHPINCRNIRGRNAGPIFFKEGRPVRPTMDCSIRYGRSMILKEILLLTPQEFIEREIAFIEPTWAPNLRGTHTYCQQEEFIVYDGEYDSPTSNALLRL